MFPLLYIVIMQWHYLGEPLDKTGEVIQNDLSANFLQSLQLLVLQDYLRTINGVNLLDIPHL